VLAAFVPPARIELLVALLAASAIGLAVSCLQILQRGAAEPSIPTAQPA
jgi:hypothetical protein